MEKGIKIQKVLSEQRIATRRQAEEWIEQGKIKINGTDTTVVDLATDEAVTEMLNEVFPSEG